MRRLLKPLWVLLALVFLFEAWLWEHLRPIVAWIVDRIAWATLKARIAAAIEGIPPYPTLFVFLVPVALLLPLKFLGLWMLAHGSWLFLSRATGYSARARSIAGFGADGGTWRPRFVTDTSPRRREPQGTARLR